MTLHINYYLAGLNKVFEVGKLQISDRFSFDLPAINSQADWQQLKQQLFCNAETFIAHVEAMPDARLDEPFIEDKYGTWLRNIKGVIEHCYYHLGQVSLIKKLIN